MFVHEVWAERGFGHVTSRPRIVRIKRAYKRACFRALRNGFSEYRGGYIFAADVSWRMKEAFRRLPVPRNTPSSQTQFPDIRCMSWNASKQVCYDEFLLWAEQQPLDVIALQETGWNINSSWTTAIWHCVHTAAKQASILVLIRATLIGAD